MRIDDKFKCHQLYSCRKKSNKNLGFQSSWHKVTKVTWMLAEIRYPHIVPTLY